MWSLDYVIEYASNGELLKWIVKLGAFDEEAAKYVLVVDSIRSAFFLRSLPPPHSPSFWTQVLRCSNHLGT